MSKLKVGGKAAEDLLAAKGKGKKGKGKVDRPAWLSSVTEEDFDWSPEYRLDPNAARPQAEYGRYYGIADMPERDDDPHTIPGLVVPAPQRRDRDWSAYHGHADASSNWSGREASARGLGRGWDRDWDRDHERDDRWHARGSGSSSSSAWRR